MKSQVYKMLFFDVNTHGIIYVLQIRYIEYSKLSVLLLTGGRISLCNVTETILYRPTIYYN